MFITLPLFLALGFVVGYSMKRESQLAFRVSKLAFGSLLSAMLTTIILAILIYFVFRVVSNYKQNITEYRFMIAFGAFSVGVVTGHWFARAKENEGGDIFKFIVGAGLVVMLTALQYDTHVFNRLVNKITKLDAIGVSVELSSGQIENNSEASHRNQADAFDDNGARWSGGDRLDFVIFSLFRLGDRELRDEQFARMFANVPSADLTAAAVAGLVDAEPHMSEVASQYIRYSCGRLKDMAAKMGATQDLLRDEVIASPDVESLINHLRIFYFLALNGGDAPTADLEADLNVLEARLNAENAASHAHSASYPENSLCAVWSKTPLAAIPQKRFGAPDFQALAYVSLTLALLEAATGDHEGAVQLLDREITRQKNEFDAEQKDLEAPDPVCPAAAANANPPPSSCAPESDAIRAQRLTAYRRLVLIARLEDTEDGIMDTWRTKAIIPARLRTLERMVDDFSSAFRILRPSDVDKFEIFRREASDSREVRCLLDNKSDEGTNKLLARWSLVRVVGMANAIENAAMAPEVLHEDERLQRKLDEYASYVSSFDVDCVKRHGYEKLENSVPRHFIKVVGKYWETRATLMSDEDDDGPNLDKLAVLCKSRKAYEQVLRMFKDESSDEPKTQSIQSKTAKSCPAFQQPSATAGVSEGPTNVPSEKVECVAKTASLDEMQSVLHDKIDEHSVNEARKRLKSAMSESFPQADVEKFCPV